MALYLRKTPVEAIQVTRKNADKVRDFVGKHGQYFSSQLALRVVTPDGLTLASDGEYIVKDGDDFFVVPAEQFEAKYKKAGD
jgi:hypothetical protein